MTVIGRGKMEIPDTRDTASGKRYTAMEHERTETLFRNECKVEPSAKWFWKRSETAIEKI